MVFRRDPPPSSQPSPTPIQVTSLQSAPPPRGEPRVSQSRIGAGLTLKADISGSEDLLIDGAFEGQVQLPDHHVTVGGDGRLRGQVHAKTIKVEGSVTGDLYATSEVVVGATGKVEGKLSAPRVNLQDGCRFQGSIDMSGGKPTAAPELTRRVGGAAS